MCAVLADIDIVAIESVVIDVVLIAAVVAPAECFVVHKGEKVGKENVSLAFSLTFQSQEDSLAADHVDSLVESVLDHLQKKFGASLRA